MDSRDRTMSFEQDRSGLESNTASRPYDSSTGNNYRTGPTGAGPATDDDHSRRLDAALHAPYGIDKLLNRLKQSIFSTREFSSFLRERCALEDRHGQGYKKLVRNTSDTIRRADGRQGTFLRHFGETLQLHERLAENGLAYASALHTMSEELRDVAENAERGRKQWKHTTIDNEKKLAEAEAAQQKAKDRYNNAAEQYDRARTGERSGGVFSLKNKNPAQQEEQLKEKADNLDREYATKFQAAQSLRLEFEGSTRRQIVQALREIIDECDAAVAMQMAKFASVTEKHVVSHGTAIAPFKASPTEAEPRGLRQIARDIDDRKDFSDYMLDGVEPPSQFKGRSRRNTDVDMAHTPLPVQRTETTETPYNPSQSHVESRPPQLPQIGGSDSFSRSFEADRPVPQNNRSSYFGGTSDALTSHPPHQTQQTGVTNELAPSLPNNRAPIGPSLPSYDRGTAPVADSYDSNSGYGRGQAPFRQDTMPAATGLGHTSTNSQQYDRSGPARQGTFPLSGGLGQTSTGGLYNDRNQGPLRQDTTPGFSSQGQTMGSQQYNERDTTGVGRGHSTVPGSTAASGLGFAKHETLPSSTGQSRTSTDLPPYNRDHGNERSDVVGALAGRGHPTVPGSTTSVGQGFTRNDTLPSSTAQGRSSMDNTSYNRDHGKTDAIAALAGRGQHVPTGSTASGTGLGSQLPLGRETPYTGNNQSSSLSTAGTNQTPVGRENPYMSTTQDSTAPIGGRDNLPHARENTYTPDRQGSSVLGVSGNQPLIGRENPYIANKQDTTPPLGSREYGATGRNSPYTSNNANVGTSGMSQPHIGRENPYMNTGSDTGRGLAASSTVAPFPSSGSTQSPIGSSGLGRSTGIQGIPEGTSPAGRGTPGAARTMLPSQQPQQSSRPMLPPTRPVFGMHLDELFRRDGSAVPAIVFQCIQAVDTFGLSTQGIYRVSGSSPTVQQLKSEFDHDSNKVDLTEREAFNNDIATVATLLKNFLRDLPDPLLTATAYHSFIQAAKYENNIMRRDALHQYINSLPDPNYATLRVLTLHLHRVSMNSDVNKMDMRNLAVVFGPTVMGGSNLADAGLQTKVMETILHHTHDIFDPDE